MVSGKFDDEGRERGSENEPTRVIAWPGHVSLAGDEESSEQWRATLEREWSLPSMSLSGAVHWRATGGAFREADADELNSAAAELLDALVRGGLVATGISPATERRKAIPADEFRDAHPFYADETIFQRAAPALLWNSELEEDRGDTFEARSGSVLWHDLRVDRAAVQKAWPTRQATTDKRRDPGRPAGIRERIADAMRRDLNAGFDLSGAKQSELVARYKDFGATNRGTCDAARKLVLSEIKSDNS